MVSYSSYKPPLIISKPLIKEANNMSRIIMTTTGSSEDMHPKIMLA